MIFNYLRMGWVALIHGKHANALGIKCCRFEAGSIARAFCFAGDECFIQWHDGMV